MDTTRVRIIKGLVHLGLAITPMLEVKHSSSKARNVLLGLAAGWHLNATYYHWFIEKGDDEDKRSRKRVARKNGQT